MEENKDFKVCPVMAIANAIDNKKSPYCKKDGCAMWDSVQGCCVAMNLMKLDDLGHLIRI